MKNLGFGMMRLPLIPGTEDADIEKTAEMADEFLAAGYTYFDTSYVYHNGKSENAVKKAVVERHKRDSFTIAAKFPVFNMIPEDKVDELFAGQLEDLGVEYADYYLLHNIQTVYYNGYDGKGGIVGSTHLFDHAKKWKEEGRIKHLGISFHSSAKQLGRVLDEHPEIEFVQLAINPIDWGSELVQACKCYYTARKLNRKVVIMEPVKGGGLAELPPEAEKLLREKHPDWSMASWAMRFSLGLDEVIAVVSEMFSPEQLRDNIKTAQEMEPLTKEESEVYARAMNIYRESAPIRQSEIDKYKGIIYNGVPVTAILQAYSICQIQPDPGLSDDNNYLKNAFAENARLNFFEGLPKQTVLVRDGSDITAKVESAVRWLREHSF